MNSFDDAFADRIIEVMNRMLDEDRAATEAIFRTRHYCNQRLAEDPTIQVSCGEPPTVSLLGVLNGLAGILPKDSKRPGWGRVTAVYEERCPRHGENQEANKGLRVGDACLLVGCDEVIGLGSLMRFERTDKQAIPITPYSVEFELPEGYPYLTTSVHLDCRRPIFRDANGRRLRTKDDCKCKDAEKP